MNWARWIAEKIAEGRAAESAFAGKQGSVHSSGEHPAARKAHRLVSRHDGKSDVRWGRLHRFLPGTAIEDGPKMPQISAKRIAFGTLGIGQRRGIGAIMPS
jgi:hypothetical protein